MSNTTSLSHASSFSIRGEGKALLKFAFFLMTAVTFIIVQVLFVSWIPAEKLRLKVTLANVRRGAKLGAWILGLRVNTEYFDPTVEGELLVSNHLSYLDVLVLAAIEPALFVTSREIREVFFLGTLTNLGGCFFVERRKHLRTPELVAKELSEITKRIDQDFKVFLFPEGTSSNGQTVLPFKAHFFQLAIDAGMVICPRVISYRGDNRDLAPWYGAMTFPDQLFNVCRENSLQVELQSLPAVYGEDYSCKFTLAGDVHRMIKDAYERN